MSDTKITDLASLAGASVATTDVAVVVDVSDTSMAPSGTDKKLTVSALGAALVALGLVDAAGAAAAAEAASQPLDADLSSIAALVTTAYGRGLLTLADAAALISSAGLDADLATFSVPANTTVSTFLASVLDDTTLSAVLTTLGLDADLATFSVPASTTVSAYGATLVDDADAGAARTTLNAARAMDFNVLDYGAISGVTQYTGVTTDVTANTFTQAAHTLVNGDYVVLTAIVSTTAISLLTTYYVVNVSGNTFKLSTTSGGSAIDLTGSNGTVSLTAVPAATLTANNTAFAAAWAAARTARGMLYVPAGDWPIGPAVLTTNTNDAGIKGNNHGRTTLWFVDTTNTGICIYQRMTDPNAWLPSPGAITTGIPSITSFVIDGSFTGTGSIGLKVGCGNHGYYDVTVRQFLGTGGANGVTGLTGAIGILAQNTVDTAANDHEFEEQCFGPRTRISNCTNGLVFDKADGHQSFGYMTCEFLFTKNCTNHIVLTNGAWVYASNLNWQGNNTTSGAGVTFIKLIGSRLSGHIGMHYEVNSATGTPTIVNVDATSIWKSAGVIDATSFAFALSSSTFSGIFHHDGPCNLLPLPQIDGWHVQEQVSADPTRTAGASNVASTFTISGDYTTRYKKGTRVRWAESSTRKYGVVTADATYGSNVTTITLNQNTDYWMAADPDDGSICYSLADPPDYPDWFAYTPTFGGYATAPTGLPLTSCTTDVTANTFTKVGHALINGDAINFTSIVSTTGISAGVVYYVVNVSGSTWKVAATSGGSAIDLTGSNGSVTTNASPGPPTGPVWRYKIHNRTVTVIGREATAGTSAAVTLSVSLPVPAITLGNYAAQVAAIVTDNNTAVTTAALASVSSAATSIQFGYDLSAAGLFTPTGPKRVRGVEITYEF